MRGEGFSCGCCNDAGKDVGIGEDEESDGAKPSVKIPVLLANGTNWLLGWGRKRERNVEIQRPWVTSTTWVSEEGDGAGEGDGEGGLEGESDRARFRLRFPDGSLSLSLWLSVFVFAIGPASAFSFSLVCGMPLLWCGKRPEACNQRVPTRSTRALNAALLSPPPPPLPPPPPCRGPPAPAPAREFSLGPKSRSARP